MLRVIVDFGMMIMMMMMRIMIIGWNTDSVDDDSIGDVMYGDEGPVLL